MATTMLGLLGVFLFIFATNTQQVSAMDKVEGKWYQTGVATEAKYFTDSKWMTKVSVLIMTLTANGDAHLNTSVTMTDNCEDRSCLKINYFLKKTQTRGKFILPNSCCNAKSYTYILDLKVDEYAIVQERWNKWNDVVYINKLFTRKPVVSPQIKWKFIKISKSNKKTAGKIVILPMKGECV